MSNIEDQLREIFDDRFDQIEKQLSRLHNFHSREEAAYIMAQIAVNTGLKAIRRHSTRVIKLRELIDSIDELETFGRSPIYPFYELGR